MCIRDRKVRSYVKDECTQFDQEAQNATLERSGGSFAFVAGKEGIVLDVDASEDIIMDYLENSWTSESADNVLELSLIHIFCPAINSARSPSGSE